MGSGLFFLLVRADEKVDAITDPHALDSHEAQKVADADVRDISLQGSD